MLIVVSPAKSLDYESLLPTKKFSEPQLLDYSEELVRVMAKKSPDEISSLMSVSSALGELNFTRFQDWERPFTPENARPALLAFNGDVYTGLDAANSFSERDFTHANKTLRILSGLYGVLRPLDLMQPYRLEMGTKLKTSRGQDLYSYWGDTITNSLNDAIKSSPGAQVLVNLASKEYFGSVNVGGIEAPIVSPVFLDAKGSAEPKIISFFAKRARGVMSAWIIQNRISSRRALVNFDEAGYHYDPVQSSADRPVFVRHHDA